jgi:hypothetical protein
VRWGRVEDAIVAAVFNVGSPKGLVGHVDFYVAVMKIEIQAIADLEDGIVAATVTSHISWVRR